MTEPTPPTVTPPAFAAWMALAFPWIGVHGPDYRNLRAAWMQGFKTGQETRRGAE